jgi:hypothetical protein
MAQGAEAMTRANHRKEWTEFALKRAAEGKKKKPRPKKEPSPQEKAAAEKALDDLVREPKR